MGKKQQSHQTHWSVEENTWGLLVLLVLLVLPGLVLLVLLVVFFFCLGSL